MEGAGRGSACLSGSMWSILSSWPARARLTCGSCTSNTLSLQVLLPVHECTCWHYSTEKVSNIITHNLHNRLLATFIFQLLTLRRSTMHLAWTERWRQLLGASKCPSIRTCIYSAAGHAPRLHPDSLHQIYLLVNTQRVLGHHSKHRTPAGCKHDTTGLRHLNCQNYCHPRRLGPWTHDHAHRKMRKREKPCHNPMRNITFHYRRMSHCYKTSSVHKMNTQDLSLSTYVPFSPAYLSGWSCWRYVVLWYQLPNLRA